MDNWITVTPESMPDADETVQIYSPDATDPVWIGYHDGEDWRYVCGGIALGVTHWQPMTEPPSGKVRNDSDTSTHGMTHK